eukprot:scaffold14903_cov107-Isochrysis_galbana.AAC.6
MGRGRAEWRRERLLSARSVEAARSADRSRPRGCALFARRICSEGVAPACRERRLQLHREPFGLVGLELELGLGLRQKRGRLGLPHRALRQLLLVDPPQIVVPHVPLVHVGKG